MHSFFSEFAMDFTPPLSDVTSSFVTSVLAGQKRLFPQSKVIFFRNLEEYEKVPTKSIWDAVKCDRKVLVYFPELPTYKIFGSARFGNVKSS